MKQNTVDRRSIQRHQLALVIFFIPMVFKMSMLPSRLAEISGTEAIFAVFLLVVTEALHLAIMVAALRMGGVAELRQRIGALPTFLITLPLLFVCGIKLLVFSTEIINYVAFFLFYNTAHLGIKIVFFIVLFYVACGGPRTFGRLAELSLFFLPLIVLLGAIFGKPALNFEYVLPLFDEGFMPVLNGMDGYLFWAFDFSPILFFKLSADDGISRRKIPFIAIAALLLIIVLTGLYVVFFANYGLAATLIDDAFARLAAFNVVTTQIGSIEWPSIVLWLLSAMTGLAVKAYASAEVLSLVKVPPRYATAAVVVAVAVLSFFVVNNIASAMRLAESAVRYVVFGLEIVSTMVVFGVLLSLKIKDKRKPRQTEAAV